MEAALPPVGPLQPAAARADSPSSPTRLRDVLLTAGEAYPAFETAFLEARHHVQGSFRIFDPQTTLRSPEARDYGETWSDLLAEVLRRGVHVGLVVSDFDALARPGLHRLAHRCARDLRAVADKLGPGAGRLRVQVAAHPARMGLLPRLALWPAIRSHLRRQITALNGLDAEARTAALRDQPGLARYLRTRADGTVAAKPFALPKVLPATHHQKLAVFDDTRVYIGGLDLNDRRYDDLDHARPAEDTWHDVQLMLEGAIAAQAQAHLARFLDETTGRQTPSAEKQDLKRTISRARTFPLPFMGPRPVVDELAGAHVQAIRQSARLIYLETQFFRDTALAAQLAARARVVPDLNVILMLPAAPEEVAFQGHDDPAMRHGEALQLRCLRRLRATLGPRLFIGTPAQPRAAADDGRATVWDAPIVYLHAKLAIFDQTTAIVSSANLNGRSLKWDTEAGAVLRASEDVTRLRDRCMGHWLGPAYTAAPERFHTATAWAARARMNAQAAPEARQGFVLPFPLEDTATFAQTTPPIPDRVV